MLHLSLVPTETARNTILLYSDAGFAYPDREGFSWAPPSPACLSTAADHPLDGIILYLTKPSSPQAAPLIELCALVKHNRHTHSVLVLAVCAARNRRAVERLKTAGVDFVVFRKDLPQFGKNLDPAFFLNQLKEENRPEQVLSRLCPHAHDTPTPEGNELTTCRAYVDWLVLGPRRLREVCATLNHTDCPYFQNPRFRQ